MGATSYESSTAGDGRAAGRAAGRPPGASEEPTLGKLAIDAGRGTSSLIRDEIALAKIELKEDAKHAAKGGAMFGAAAFLGLLATVLISFALVYAVHALGLPLGWSFLVVALLYLLLAGVLGFIGKKAVTQIKGPQRTIRAGKDTVAELKRRHAAASGSGDSGPGLRERLDAAKARVSSEAEARVAQTRTQVTETANRLTEPGGPLASAKGWVAGLVARTPLGGSGARRTVRSTPPTTVASAPVPAATSSTGGATAMGAPDLSGPTTSPYDPNAGDERV